MDQGREEERERIIDRGGGRREGEIDTR